MKIILINDYFVPLPVLSYLSLGLPVCPELTRDTIPRSRDVGHFLSVTGTVIRTSVAKVTVRQIFIFQQFDELRCMLKFCNVMFLFF